LLAWCPADAKDDTSHWMVYAGAQSFQWETTGGRSGHTVDCRTKACDGSDFNRANLDSSFGFRFGAERSLRDGHPLHLRAGAEAGLLFTEYDLSQHDLKLLELMGVIAVGADIGPLRPMLRAGLGGTLSDDGHARPAAFLEAALDVPVSHDTALRLAARLTERNGPDGNDLSVLVVTRGARGEVAAEWELDTQAGISFPGGLVGEDRELSRAPFWQISAFRGVGGGRNRIGFGVDIAGFESSVRTEFKGVSGNERSKEINGFTALWDLELPGGERTRWRIGAGAKLADWKDRYNLLLDDQGQDVLGSRTELGVLLKAETVFRPQSRFPILGGVEQVYWPDIDLGELRLRAGLQIAL
jgi:hypothetical protein